MLLSLSFIVCAFGLEYCYHFCFVVSSSLASVRFLSLRSRSRALAFRVSVHISSLRVCRVLLVQCVGRLALRCHVDCLLAPKYCARFAAQTSDPFLPRVMDTDFVCMLWSVGLSLRSAGLSDCALVLFVKKHNFLWILSDCAGLCSGAMLPHCSLLFLTHDSLMLESGCGATKP